MEYRSFITSRRFETTLIKEAESDILILANNKNSTLKKRATALLRQARKQIKDYISRRPDFETSFKPLEMDDEAPEIIKQMLLASAEAGVGPMAAVAGAVSQLLGKGLMGCTEEIIIENGGDIFIKTNNPAAIGLYAGRSPLSRKIALQLPKSENPLGVCTSSGTVGHSFSQGKADALAVVAQNAVYADAWATALANRIKSRQDIKKVLNLAKKEPGIIGCVAIMGAELGACGNIELKSI